MKSKADIMCTMEKVKNNFIVLLFLVLTGFFVLPVIAATPSTSQLSQISKIESSIWGFEYSNDDTQKRLSRIENNVFGEANTKNSIDERIKKLNEAMGFESFEDSLKEAYELDNTVAEGVSYPQIDKLEYQMFQKTYEQENIYRRLERLEQKIFGSIQDGNLSSRTDKLKAYLKQDVIASDAPGDYYTERPYTTTKDIEQYSNYQNRYDNSDVFIQLSGLETTLFSKTYSQDPVGLRLNRLERKIFQRDFSSDEDYIRIQRLQAAANAQQTAKLYEANKIQKYASTGIQLGSIILMILALIL